MKDGPTVGQCFHFFIFLQVPTSRIPQAQSWPEDGGVDGAYMAGQGVGRKKDWAAGPGLEAGRKLSKESENSTFKHGLLGHYKVYFTL